MDAKILHELFDYRDGELYWKPNKGGNKVQGKRAGTMHHEGYVRTQVNGKIYGNHRLIFLMHHGYLPDEVDHIDLNKSNNKIENLRPAMIGENQRNVSIRKDNTSGAKGVYWNKSAKKWVVQVRLKGKNGYFGLYEDIEIAKKVATEARKKYHEEFANHG